MDAEKRPKPSEEDADIESMLQMESEMQDESAQAQAEDEDFSMTAEELLELEYKPPPSASSSSSASASASASASSLSSLSSSSLSSAPPPRALMPAKAGVTATASAEDLARWKRPELDPSFNEGTSPLAFMWTAVDLMTGDPLASHPRGASFKVPGSSTGPVPIIRLFGVNEAGNSVACFIHGFTPYLYCILPRGVTTGPAFEGTVRNVSKKNAQAAVRPGGRWRAGPRRVTSHARLSHLPLSLALNYALRRH